jgi:hypothetical protein
MLVRGESRRVILYGPCPEFMQRMFAGILQDRLLSTIDGLAQQHNRSREHYSTRIR